MQDEYYEIGDTTLAAALMCHDLQLEGIKKIKDINNKTKIFFLFKNSERLKYKIDEFYRDALLVEARKNDYNRRTLMSRIKNS